MRVGGVHAPGRARCTGVRLATRVAVVHQCAAQQTHFVRGAPVGLVDDSGAQVSGQRAYHDAVALRMRLPGVSDTIRLGVAVGAVAAAAASVRRCARDAACETSWPSHTAGTGRHSVLWLSMSATCSGTVDDATTASPHATSHNQGSLCELARRRCSAGCAWSAPRSASASAWSKLHCRRAPSRRPPRRRWARTSRGGQASASACVHDLPSTAESRGA